MKCDTCKFQEIFNYDDWECGSGQCDANCNKGHWTGFGESKLGVEIDPDPWSGCGDYEQEEE